MGIQLKTAPKAFITPEYEKAFAMFCQTIQDKNIGFFNVNQRQDLLESSAEIAQQFSSIKHFVHVGIGGSSLGPEMLIKSLQKNERSFHFINNIDPDFISDEFNKIDIKNTLFYFVSKSGGTAETIACLALIMNRLEDEGIHKNELKNYFVFATDPHKSDLLKLAKELEVNCLEIPTNVGGRFSALTPVAYLPCLMAGVDAKELCRGAEEIKKTLLNKNLDENLLMAVFSPLVEAFDNDHVNQTVLMPYSSKLKELSDWFVQLWAESLGKRHKNSELRHTGLTPIRSYGVTDQHSQMQLFIEGPPDKCLILLEVEQTKTDFSLHGQIDLPAFKNLAPYKLSQLMRAELHGTIKALEEAQRPVLHLSIQKNDEYHLGGLVLLFECLTVLMGHHLGVNPFDQPGVEAGKRYAFEWLEKVK